MENKLAIIVDSGTDIPQKFKESLNIFELPFQIIYTDKIYEDRITIDSQTVYDYLSYEVPTTSLPSGEFVMNLLDNLKKQCYTDIIFISISDQLTGTYQFIQLISNHYPNFNWYFFNTKSIGIGAGLFAIEAATRYKNGESINQIKQTVFDPSKCEVYFKLDTLKYLKKGGRIGSIHADIGSLLKIKPIITFNNEGSYKTYKLVKSKKQFYKVISLLLETAINKYGSQHLCIGIGEGAATQQLDELKKYIESMQINIPIIYSSISPALGVHTGPGLIGIAIYHF